MGGSSIAMYSLPVVSYPTNLRALGLGCCIGFGRIGAILSPIVTGYLIGAGWEIYSLLLFVMFPGVLIATAILKFVRLPQ